MVLLKKFINTMKQITVLYDFLTAHHCMDHDIWYSPSQPSSQKHTIMFHPASLLTLCPSNENSVALTHLQLHYLQLQWICQVSNGNGTTRYLGVTDEQLCSSCKFECKSTKDASQWSWKWNPHVSKHSLTIHLSHNALLAEKYKPFIKIVQMRNLPQKIPLHLIK